MLCAALATITMAAGTCTCANGFPEKPVRLIVPYSAGANADLLGRIVARKLQESWGQAMTVENLPGGESRFGVATAAKAPPDGYTLVMVTPAFVTNATSAKKLTYDSLRDFSPVTLVATSPLLLVTHPSMPAKNVAELLALAKSKLDSIAYASSGQGSLSHLGMELLRGYGALLLHTPYQSTAAGVTDLLGGQVQVMLVSLNLVKPHVKALRLRALGVSTAKRSAALPQVPAIAETLKDYEVINWWGVLAPADTPIGVVNQLNSGVVRLLRDTDVQETLAQEGIDRAGSSPAEFGTHLRSEFAKWSKLARDRNSRIDEPLRSPRH